jgi:hypothetical protein
MKQWPTFLIVGAPKAGTTTLSNWLEGHPQVYMCPRKDSQFFCGFDFLFQGPGADLTNKLTIRDEETYLRHFRPAVGYRHRGEVSAEYLYFETAARNIQEKIPEAKIIIILRNPAERMYSEHMHLVRDGYETGSFKKALLLEESRARGRWTPIFWHMRRSFYSESVKRYLKIFGAKNVCILLFDDLHDSPQAFFRSVTDFLDLDPFDPDYAMRLNKSGHARIQLLQNLAGGKTFPQLQRPTKRWLREKKGLERLVRRLLDLNLRETSFPEEAKASLIQHFIGDISKLETLLGWDLSRWKTSPVIGQRNEFDHEKG